MRRSRLIAVCLAAALLSGGCGSVSSESPESRVFESTDALSSSAEDIHLPTDSAAAVSDSVTEENLPDFIELGEYKGLRIEAGDSVPLADGMTANIDYSGTIDGAAFDGGSQEHYDLLLGSGSFPGDFEEQLTGLRKGDKKEVSVTFPRDYGSDELAGKEAVYTVTVNQGYYVTPDIAWSQFLDSCRVLAYPAQYVEDAEQTELESYRSFLGGAEDLTRAEILKTFGISEEMLRSIALGRVKERLAAESLMHLEGISRSDEQYQALLQTVQAKSGNGDEGDGTLALTEKQLQSAADTLLSEEILVRYEAAD